ncbi:9-divinyl ether synthase [Trichoplax sp. H2]|uniref:sterol 22-desaturase n=1 Tax=Trichoplax adhaerens TaxID=10228 RepID=B3RP47_TRIAD|nr:expressed hypothetical protein [Trichoplax adhaerens]EDV28127.1 expressed hypothetical protein [Trichoplax adhaerens]RDD38713.1 9-divinyl ether synthase [Trichoplax sp. H2]|eukprot:XP_002109961.1 expressed hypothetical protein [Trichoplax adhaerens]
MEVLSRKLHRRRRSSREDTIQSIPGSHGHKFISSFKLQQQGNLYFKTLQQKYQQNVFRINIGVRAIALVDNRVIRILFQNDKVTKEDGVGNYITNYNLMDSLRPSIFSDQKDRMSRNSFILQTLAAMQDKYIIQQTYNSIEDHFQRWNKTYQPTASKSIQPSWDDGIQHLCCDIICRLFIDKTVNFESIFQWYVQALQKIKVPGLLKQRQCADIYNTYIELFKEIENSTYLPYYLNTGRQCSLSDEYAKENVLFGIIFNAFGSCEAIMRTCAARIGILSHEDRNQLRQEIQSTLGEGNDLSLAALTKMKRLRSFVAEVLRTSSPISLIFRRAKQDMFIQAYTGTYKISKGHLLVGNIHLAHRDPNVFPEPDTFKPFRFYDDPELIRHMIWEAGVYPDEAKNLSHQCPGKKMMMILLQLFCMKLLIHTEFQFDVTPDWNEKHLHSLGCPDGCLTLNQFSYDPAMFKIKLSDDICNSHSPFLHCED